MENRDYLGHTVNFKTTRLSYKSKKMIENPLEKQVVFENTHEALVSQETWDIVQKNRQNRRRPTKMGDAGMFSGLLYCADCGHSLNLNRTKSWAREQDNYVCGTYKRRKGSVRPTLSGRWWWSSWCWKICGRSSRLPERIQRALSVRLCQTTWSRR